MARVEATAVLGREPDEEVSLAIRLATLCRELHVLPRAGGVLDQDPYELSLLEAGLVGLSKKFEHDRKRGGRGNGS